MLIEGWLCSELLNETTGVVAHTLAREGDPLLPITRESTDKKAAEQKRKDKVRWYSHSSGLQSCIEATYKHQIAINVNFGINVFLLLTKILVVVLSNSLSLLASAVDSTMDLVSVLIIFFTARAAGKPFTLTVIKSMKYGLHLDYPGTTDIYNVRLSNEN